MPLVTIGLPVYNGDRFLGAALDAVLTQTFSDMEVLISDNASTDGTRAICEAYAARDPRVRYLRNAGNLGAAKNYNALVDCATGEFFKWAPHDDLITPTYVAQCVDVLRAHPEAVLCYPRTMVVNEEGIPQGEETEDTINVTAGSPHARFGEFLTSSWYNRKCNAVVGLIRTAPLRTTGLIGPYGSSDRILLAELALRGTFCQIQEPLFFRRLHAGGSVPSNPDFASRTRWFDPSATGTGLPPHWRWLREYVQAVRRAGIGCVEKELCYAQLLRLVWLDRRPLRSEVREAISAAVAPKHGKST
jgi:glycosyltransferase involved in cell wall biosynthesis